MYLSNGPITNNFTKGKSRIGWRRLHKQNIVTDPVKLHVYRTYGPVIVVTGNILVLCSLGLV